MHDSEYPQRSVPHNWHETVDWASTMVGLWANYNTMRLVNDNWFMYLTPTPCIQYQICVISFCINISYRPTVR